LHVLILPRAGQVDGRNLAPCGSGAIRAVPFFWLF
jgi:hypothetical protein